MVAEESYRELFQYRYYVEPSKLDMRNVLRWRQSLLAPGLNWNRY